MQTYNIIKTEKIIIQIWEDDISLNDLLEAYHQIRKDSIFSSDYSIVSDFRKARILISLSEIRSLANYLLVQQYFSGRWIALVDRSLDAAKISVFKEIISSSIHFTVLSKVERTSSLLKIDLSQYLGDDRDIREDFYL